MANTKNGNSFFVDTSSSSGTAGSWIADKKVTLLGVVWLPSATSDLVEIFDLSATSSAASTQKLKLRSATALNTVFLNFQECPILCPNGIWVTITGSPIATLIFSTGGS